MARLRKDIHIFLSVCFPSYTKHPTSCIPPPSFNTSVLESGVTDHCYPMMKHFFSDEWMMIIPSTWSRKLLMWYKQISCKVDTEFRNDCSLWIKPDIRTVIIFLCLFLHFIQYMLGGFWGLTKIDVYKGAPKLISCLLSKISCFYWFPW